MRGWKVYKRSGKLWLGYEWGDGCCYGLVSGKEVYRQLSQYGGMDGWAYVWHMNQTGISQPRCLRNMQSIAEKLDLTTKHNRKLKDTARMAREHDVEDYLDEHATDDASAWLMLSALAARLNELGCRFRA